MKTHPKGTDLSLTRVSRWEDFNNHSNIGEVKINYEVGDDSKRITTIIEDPDSPGNQYLQFQIFELHIKEGSKFKGRVQMELHNNQFLRDTKHLECVFIKI